MNCCIKNPKYLGCFSTCETLKTGLTATVPGDYTFNCYFSGFVQPITKTFALNANLDFDISPLNEKAVYKADLTDPTGTALNVPTFDGFGFKTILQVTK